MSISINLYVTASLPAELLAELELTEASGYRGVGIGLVHPSGMSASVLPGPRYEWDMVVTDLGIDYRANLSMTPGRGDLRDQIDLIVDIGVRVISRVGETARS